MNTIEAVNLSRGIVQFSPETYLRSMANTTRIVGVDKLREIYSLRVAEKKEALERTFPKDERDRIVRVEELHRDYIVGKLTRLVNDSSYHPERLQGPDTPYFRPGALRQLKELDYIIQRM